MLPESLAEGRVAVISGGKRHLGDVHRTHPQLTPGAFQPDPADVANGALAHVRREDPVEVRHRESGNLCQRFTIERLADVLTDIAHHVFDALRMVLKDLCLAQHTWNIVYQNTCSLFQMYHLAQVAPAVPQGCFAIAPLDVKLFRAWGIKLIASPRSLLYE